jgi:hypothetical protein
MSRCADDSGASQGRLDSAAIVADGVGFEACAYAPTTWVRENLCLHFLNFCLCVCMQQGRHIAHKFESRWEVE